MDKKLLTPYDKEFAEVIDSMSGEGFFEVKRFWRNLSQYHSDIFTKVYVKLIDDERAILVLQFKHKVPYELAWGYIAENKTVDAIRINLHRADLRNSKTPLIWPEDRQASLITKLHYLCLIADYGKK